jgi:hypothetical protein
MNVVDPRGSTGWLYTTLICATAAVVGLLLVAVWHAQIGRSLPLAVVIALSFAASAVGTVGGLILAGRRRNVMWILAVSVSAASLVALLATVVASLAPD